MRKLQVIVERDEDGVYVANVPAIRGCRTQAPDMQTLMDRIRELAIVLLEDDPDFSESEFVSLESIEVPC